MVLYPQFPKDFCFGTATAAYQIEGGWDADGKGPSTWDTFVRRPGQIRDGHTGDVACDTYNDFQTDIKLMAGLGHNSYRFSVAWSRVLPQGKGPLNKQGLDYYNRLVDALLDRNITPFITLFHWEMPQALYEACGGFAGRDVASYFADYAELVARSLGDRVNHWITLNEPWEHAMLGHFLGEHAPGKSNPWTYFKVAHHQLLGHGLAAARIKQIAPGSRVGITLSQFPVTPIEQLPKHIEAAKFADMFINRFYLDALYKGRYPESLLKRLWLFWPRIEPDDLEIISYPTDFLGINYYSRLFAYPAWYIPFFGAWVDGQPPPGLEIAYPELQQANRGYEVYPQGLYQLVTRMRDDYGNPPVYITENGIALAEVVEDGRVHDPHRIHFLQLYLAELERAIHNGADVRGYFIWSLLDNFEWAEGYNKRFGIIYVDHNTQQRIVKDSAIWYRDLIQNQTAG